MTYKLFLDDERFPIDDDWEIVRSYEAATNLIMEKGLPEYMSLDHDLGNNETGYDFIKWLIEYMFDNEPKRIDFYIHSQNPIGKANMENLLNSFYETWSL